MKGVVEVIQHHAGGGSEVVYRDDNMIVDGAKKTIVNMLTHVPTPSGAAETYKTADQSVYYLGTNEAAKTNINTAFFNTSSFLSSTENTSLSWKYPPRDSNGNTISDVYWADRNGTDPVSLEWSSTGEQGKGFLQVSGGPPAGGVGSAEWMGGEFILSSISCPSGYFYYVQCDVRQGDGSILDTRVDVTQKETAGTHTSSLVIGTAANSGWATRNWFTVSGVYDFRTPSTANVEALALEFWIYDGGSTSAMSEMYVDNVIVRRMDVSKPPGVDVIGDYQIKAMTLGSAKQNFDAHESRYGAEYIHTDTSSQYLYMSGVSSTIFSLAPPVPNHVLDETGNKGNTVANGQLEYLGTLSNTLSFGEPVQIEGSPEIKDYYINSNGEEVPAVYINKKFGQDYAILEAPIVENIGSPFALSFKGEATVPVEVSLVKKTFPKNIPFSTTPEKQEYYNFETRTFTQAENTKEITLSQGNDSKIVYDPILARLPKGAQLLHSKFFLRVVVPRRSLYEKGFVAIEEVTRESTTKYALGNPTFLNTNNFLLNSEFSDYTYLKNAPDYLASALSLVDFGSWEEDNPISNSQNVIDEISSIGSLTLYEDITGDKGVTFQASCDSSVNPSGSASISQRFSIPPDARNWFVNLNDNPFINSNGMHTAHFSMSMDVYTASSDSDGIVVSLENETAESHYSFQDITASSIVGNVWGTNSPLVISELQGNAVSGEFVSISHIINLPASFIEDSFRLKITARGGRDGSMAKYTVKNVKFGMLRDWSYAQQGTNNSAQNKSTLVLPSNTMGEGIIFSAVDKVINSQAVNGASLEGITYIGQTFSNVDPKKKYNLIIDAEKMSPSGDASLGLSFMHSDYSNHQSTQGDVMKLCGLQNPEATQASTNNIGILYCGYTKFLNSTSSPRKVNSYRGLQINNPNYHNKYERAVHFSPPGNITGEQRNLYVPTGQNSRYTISVDSARRQVSSGYYESAEGGNVTDLRNMYCSVYVWGGNVKYTYNFSTKEWVSLANGIDDTNYINHSFLLNEVGLPPRNQPGWTPKDLELQTTTAIVDTPKGGDGTLYNANEDGSLSVQIEFFYMAEDVTGGFSFPIYDSAKIGYQQLYIRDFSMLGNYPTTWDELAHFNYGPTDPPSGKQCRAFTYDWDGTWTKIGNSEADLFTVSPYGYLSGIEVVGIPSIDFTSSGNNQICVPIYGMDVLMGDTPVDSGGFSASSSATSNSTYSLFLIHNKGCSIKVNSVSLVDASLGAYGGPVLSSKTQITTSENIGASRVPDNLVGGWHSHFVSSIEGAPVPNVYVRDLSGYQFLAISGSPSVPYQAPTVAYSQYVSQLGLTNEKISISVDQMGVTDALFKCIQLYNSKTEQRQIWDMDTQTWTPDNESYPFSLSKYKNKTKPFRVPNESSKSYYPAIDWTTSGITLPLWKSSKPDPRILTVMFRQGPNATGQYYLRNLRFYSNYTQTEVSSVYPEFPSPEDTGIQPEKPGTPGKLGHFLNHVEFYTSGTTFTKDKTFEEALNNGCYPPAEGVLYFSGAGGNPTDTPTRLYGNLNRFSVITPNGYILEQQRMPYGKSTMFDSSCGFVTEPSYDVYFSSTAHDTNQYGVFYLTDNLLSVSSADVMGSNGNFEGGYLISGVNNGPNDPNHWNGVGVIGRDQDVFFSSISSGTTPNTAKGQDWAYASRAGDSRWSLILSGDDDGAPADWKGYSYNFNQWTAPSGYHYLAKQDVQFLGGSGADQHFFISEKSSSHADQTFLELATGNQMEWLENHHPNEFSSVSAVGWYGDAIGAAATNGHLHWNNYTYKDGTPANATSSVAAIDNLSLQRCCGPGDEMAKPRVKYSITLSRDEWELLDKMYGGIEAVGLHTMNLIDTAKKRGSDRGLAIPPYLTSGTQYPFSSTMTFGDLPTQFPMDGASRSAPMSPGSESINSMCLRARELPTEVNNSRSISRLFHTSFGYPPLDPLGWASGVGDSLTLAFDYKIIDDPATLGTPTAYIKSPHFGEIKLGGKKGVWQSASKTFSIAASGVGKNTIMWTFAEGLDQSLAGNNEIRLDNLKLTNVTKGDILVNYNFEYKNNGYLSNDASAFSTDWDTPNFMHLDRMYDGSWYESSLYNINQLTLWEPEFDLFAKKVFFPGGLKLGDNSDKLTIIWTLYF